MISQFADDMLTASNFIWAAINSAKGMPDKYRSGLVEAGLQCDKVIKEYIADLEQEAGRS